MVALEFNEDIRDGFQEIANIAVGLAGDNIARSFKTFVQLPIPQVHLIESADIQMVLDANTAGDKVTAVTQAFFGSAVSGEALLLFTDASMTDLSALMGYQEHKNLQAELVLEMASLLNGSCIQGFCAQLDIAVLLKHPKVLGQEISVTDIFSQQGFSWKQTLAIELNYVFEGFDVCCDLVLLFHEESLPALFDTIQLLIE